MERIRPRRQTRATHTLNGNAGNDLLLGQGGDDILEGTLGVDRAHGGAGNDKVHGGGGLGLSNLDNILVGGSDGGFDICSLGPLDRQEVRQNRPR